MDSSTIEIPWFPMICSAKCLSECSKFAKNFCFLHDNRGVKRILHWNPRGGLLGRSLLQWKLSLVSQCHTDFITVCSATMVFFSSFTCIIFSLYIQCFGFHILCSKRAAARHTRSKEKKPTAFQCKNLNITVPARRVKKSQFVCQVGHGLSHIA